MLYKINLLLLILLLLCYIQTILSNPDAKRLYDDLLSNYNRLIRPVSNNTDTVLVKLGLRLSQLIELVCFYRLYQLNYFKFSRYFLLQNLKDQILTTNVWLEHVCLVIQIYLIFRLLTLIFLGMAGS